MDSNTLDQFIGGTAYVGGTFDLFHVGHVRLFQRAKEIFSRVVVSINTDEFAAAYKRVPIMKFSERMEMITACRYVDHVVVNHKPDSRGLILGTQAQYIVHGSDWIGDSLMKQMCLTPEWLSKHGIQMFYLPYTVGVSTTEIMERIYDDAHL